MTFLDTWAKSRKAHGTVGLVLLLAGLAAIASMVWGFSLPWRLITFMPAPRDHRETLAGWLVAASYITVSLVFSLSLGLSALAKGRRRGLIHALLLLTLAAAIGMVLGGVLNTETLIGLALATNLGSIVALLLVNLVGGRATP